MIKATADAQRTASQGEGGNALLENFFLRTLWLFTKSGFLTFCIPDAIFGIFGALSGPFSSGNNPPDLLQVLFKIPGVILWTWLNVLVTDLAHQRLPESIKEDAVNKPGRPIPSGRISMTQNRRVLLFALPIILVINCLVGAWRKLALIFVMAWIYNDLGGGDEGIIRDIIPIFAFCISNKGALRVRTVSDTFSVTPRTNPWPAITSGMIGTTAHIQDFKDHHCSRIVRSSYGF